MKKVGFIGTGNMGSAIIKGILGSDLKDVSVYAYDSFAPSLEKAAELGVTALSSNAQAAQCCDYLFLAVKPQQLDEVLESIADCITENIVLISICAGISDEYIAKKTKPFVKVVMAMPNTPLLLGEGATAISRSETVSDEEFEFVSQIFSSCGICREVPKVKMKEIIAINGSSPAFIYLYAQCFIDYAKSVGIDEAAAKELFAKTLVGSAKMITDSGNSIERLIEMVSSKGGTTIAGLEKLREGSLDKTVQSCCEACTKRAYELAGEDK